MKPHRSFDQTLLMVLVCVLPLFIFIVLILNGVAISPLFFLVLVLACCAAMMYFMQGAPTDEHEGDTEEANDAEADENLTLMANVREVFRVRSQRKIERDLVAEGALLVDADAAYESLKRRFENTDTTPLLQEDDSGNPVVVLAPGALGRTEGKTRTAWLNVILFVLTLGTTTWAGAAHQGVNLWENPARFGVGLPYALALMLILGAHELGHYFAARYHKLQVTLPYFVPVPFALGTFGAFIQLKSPSENRRSLFDVGVAGPLAGLVFAIPALLIGLQSSQIVRTGSESLSMMQGGVSIGSSFLLALLAKLSLGEAVTEGHQLLLSPLGFAGWLGVLVTALNLLPIGQLDGGHIAHALFGRKSSNTIGMVALFSLFLLGLFVWSGLLTWAIIVFFIAGTKSAPPLNDVSKLDTWRSAVGALAFVLLFLILTPVPHAFYHSLGIHCPYI